MFSDPEDHEENKKEYEKAIVVKKKAEDIKDISLLRRGFNIHDRPSNYLSRRTKIEEIIYHAVTADTVKSPYTRFVDFIILLCSFKMANQNLLNLLDLDVISGMRVRSLSFESNRVSPSKPL